MSNTLSESLHKTLTVFEEYIFIDIFKFPHRSADSVIQAQPNGDTLMLSISPGISTETIDYLFSSTMANTQANLDSLAGTILGQGIDFFQDGDYNNAINAFRRSAALSPFSDNTAKAYDYLGQSYLKLENTEEAIKVFQEAIRLYPTNAEFQLALGDIYLTEKDNDKALKAYKAAVQLDPTDAESRYSLGQCYLAAGELDKAREQFSRCVQMTPTSAAGYYGLGQTARIEKNYEDAISQLKKAIQVNRDFEKAYIELGYTYADMGDFQKASEQAAVLSSKGSSQATTLGLYITGASQPKILSVLSLDGFNTALGRSTQVSTLNSSLASAGRSKLFSMNLTFSKDMDLSSVLNRNNWTITRASIRANGGVYNGGFMTPSTEAYILPAPVSVSYDSEKNMATVQFRISQNGEANATIDPAHIVFKFNGLDAYGKAMDKSADEYSGFSKIA
jgi:tetratricopeptide (TPR) repeat protein